MYRLHNLWALLAVFVIGLLLVLGGRETAPISSSALVDADRDSLRISDSSVEVKHTPDGIGAKTSVVIELLSLDDQAMQIIIEPPDSVR